MSNECNFYGSNNCCTIKGDKGEKGEIGFTGMQGNKGEQGIKGQKGEPANVEQDININSIRVKTIRATEKIKVKKISGLNELGVTASNTLDINSNIIPDGDSLLKSQDKNYKNFDLGSITKPWSNLYIRNVNSKNVVSDDIIVQDLSASLISSVNGNNNNIFIKGNLIPNQKSDIGSKENIWNNIFVNDISSNSIKTVDILASEISGDNIKANYFNVKDLSSVNLEANDILSNIINVNNLNALFDISSSNISGTNVFGKNIDGIKLNINEIQTDNSKNEIIFNSDLIPGDNTKTFGSKDDNWNNAFIKNLNTNTIKTTDSSNNILFEGNFIPKGVKDTSNIVNLDIGDDKNIWNKAFINDISLNNLSSLNDDKNITVSGNLMPSGPYNKKTSSFSLGSRENQWKDLYVSTGTIYIGGAALGINETIVNNKKTIELVFYPNTESDISGNSDEKSIVVAGADFNIITEQKNGETKETLQPIEETFASGKLLDLQDVDISKNLIKNGDIIMYDESKEKFVIGEAAVANNSNQTLLEVLSEQPRKFNKLNSNVTSGSITMEWSYDDILVKYDDDTNRLLTKGANTKDKMIPYIDKIHVDISGTIHGLPGNLNSNKWIPYNIGDYDNNGDREISINDSYDTTSYKILTIQKTQSSTLNTNSTNVERILSEPGFPISVRIYGINDSRDNDILKNNRSIYFNFNGFLSASPPKQPVFVSENITSSEINLIYRTQETEDGNPSSTAKIVKAITRFNEEERLISNNVLLNSSPYIINSNVQTKETIFSLSDNKINNSNLELEVNDIRPGTRYKYNVGLVNNLVSTESSRSTDFTSTRFTDIPQSLFQNSLFFNINNSDKTNILNKSLGREDRIYINLGNTNNSEVVLKPKISNGNTFTKNNADIELSSNFKFGKNLDGTIGSDIVNINVYVDSLHKQIVKFNGYNASNSASNFNNLNNRRVLPNIFFFVSDLTSQDDMFNNNSIQNYKDKMGFRLKANVVMSEMKVSDIRSSVSSVGRETPFEIKYEYIRKGKLYQNNTDVITSNHFDLYIDNLNVDPSFSINSRKEPTINVENIVYCMGIPTVHKFTLSFDTTQQNSSRTYKNINSTFGFMRGDLKIGDIQIIGDTTPLHNSNTGLKQIKLKNNGLIKKVQNQEYNLSETNFSSDITSYFKNFQYTQNNYTTTNNIKIKEKIYSLRTGDNGINQTDIILNTKHYCDYNSFNNFTSSTPSVKITNTIVEIDNINNFSSNVGGITTSIYYHTSLVKDSTLLFINGQFQTNSRQSYPITTNYLFHNKTLLNTGYTSLMATKAYDLNGNSTTQNKKYKWIGFKLTSSNITLDNNTNISYVNINNILRKYFNGTTFDKLITNDDNVVGFIKVENSIGNLSKNYNTLSPWDGISSVTSLSDLFINANKGAIYKQNGTSWGPVVNPSNTLNGIFIFIGLNNSVSL
jgi:hypothetical protein